MTPSPIDDLVKYLAEDSAENVNTSTPKRRILRQIKELVIILKEKGILNQTDINRLKDVE